MKKLAVGLMLTLLSASAFAAKKAPVDADCHKMASNARGFAELKATGLATTEEQLSAFVVSPTVQSYPIKSIVRYVMAIDGKTPEQVYQDLYGRCTLMGYQELYSYFQDREEADILREKLAAANATISALEEDKLKLSKAVLELQPKPRKK